MIQTKQDLKAYIKADESRYSMRHPRMLGWILSDETYFVKRYLNLLRRLEYMTNKKKHLWDYPYYFYLVFRHRRISLKSGLHISPNVVGKGLYIPHISGGGIIINADKLGDYCTVNAGVVVGNKTGQIKKAVIGNNVEITLGAKVIGAVNIGDNVIIAPNSVVVKDVEANTIVSGVPARFLKRREL